MFFPKYMVNNNKVSPTGGIGRRAWLRTMSFFKVGVQVPRRAPTPKNH